MERKNRGKMPVGIIAALDFEAEKLIGRMSGTKKEKVGGMTFYAGTLCGLPCVVSVSGVGKVNAALCARTMILKYGPCRIFKTGVAGTLTDKAGIGDLVIAENIVQHDFDTTPIGEPAGYLYRCGSVYYPCDPRSRDLLALAEKAGLKAVYGTVATGDQFVASEEKKDRIRKLFGGVSCEMEAGAVAQACELSNVPLTVVLSISDSADGSGPQDFQSFARTSAENHERLLLDYLSSGDVR